MPTAESMRTAFDYRPPPRSTAPSPVRWVVSGLAIPMIVAMAVYYLATGSDRPGYAPAARANVVIPAHEARVMHEEFDALAASHTDEEFQILNTGEPFQQVYPSTREPETGQWVERVRQIKALLGDGLERSRSGLKAGWTFVTGVVERGLSGIRSYAQEYQQKRSTSLIEDILLSVFSNGLSQFLFAFFGAVLGVMFGRRRKRAPTTKQNSVGGGS